MFALERQKRIIEILNDTGAVSVSRLSAELDVTEETVRRDLERLEKQELLRRTHGGALTIDDIGCDLSLKKRKATNIEAKERLAKAAVELIATGDTIFLDASTTTFYMARELKRQKTAVTVITTSLRIIDELADNDTVNLIGIGGTVSDNRSFVGKFAENSIAENYFASKVFFSAKGIVRGSGILESNEQECAVKQQMIKNSNERYFLCDKSKIGRIGFIKLAGIEEIDGFITEEDIDEDWRKELAELAVNVVISE